MFGNRRAGHLALVSGPDKSTTTAGTTGDLAAQRTAGGWSR